MYQEYRRRCQADPREFNPGDCWLWRSQTSEWSPQRPWVFNLATQEDYWRSRATYEAIRTALQAMRQQADSEEITSIACPRIGAGYGGLSWAKVRVILQEVFGDWPGDLWVYETFVPSEPSTD